jgi:hypothetical protein
MQMNPIDKIKAAPGPCLKTTKGTEMNLHGQIMNLYLEDMPTLPLVGGSPATREALAYKVGYRDARHAAAELALKADAAMEEAAKIIMELCECYGHPKPDATLARLLGGA